MVTMVGCYWCGDGWIVVNSFLMKLFFSIMSVEGYYVGDLLMCCDGLLYTSLRSDGTCL